MPKSINPVIASKQGIKLAKAVQEYKELIDSLTTPNHQRGASTKSIGQINRNAQETLYASSHKTVESTPTYLFCGTEYNLNLKRSDMIGVDFDGTIAVSMRPYDPRRAGPPLGENNPKSAFNLVKTLLKQGKKVVILTARMNSKEHTPAQLQYTRNLLGSWTKKNFGIRLPCTAEKHHLMSRIIDDRAEGVDSSTGILKCLKKQ